MLYVCNININGNTQEMNKENEGKYIFYFETQNTIHDHHQTHEQNTSNK